uniref:ATP-dependent DNA helicase PIF1-like n=1 Tax=Tanacetum cinerariifolium TaxID=118510 RepID=A0A6L2M1W8_TANCI|nr:ATP-dependent DNA helicase PIF1-like [Tanacetum cinerariifolium]
MLAKLPVKEKVYYSSDFVLDVSESLYTTEFLNTIKMYGIPRHKLVLKISAPIMCLRNIDQRGGKAGIVVAIPRTN